MLPSHGKRTPPPPRRAGLAYALAPIGRHHDSGQEPDAWVAVLDSAKGGPN